MGKYVDYKKRRGKNPPLRDTNTYLVDYEKIAIFLFGFGIGAMFVTFLSNVLL